KYFPFRLDQVGHYHEAMTSPTVSNLLIIFLLTLLIGKLFILRPQNSCPVTSFKVNNSANVAQNTAFVFDLHGVVFRFSPLRAAGEALATTYKNKLFWAACNPFLIWDVLKLLRTSGVVEKAILEIAHKYPSLKELIPLALTMANQQIPIEHTVQLIRE